MEEKKMNGDLGKIYKAINRVATDIAVLVERQGNQHKENRRDVEEIKSFMRGCPIKNIAGQIKVQWFVLGAILLGLMGVYFGQ